MRRKFNQKGLLGSLAAGLAVLIGVVVFVDAINKSAYDFIRTICIGLDSVVYSVSSWAYSIFYEISSSSLLSSLNLASASQRLYTLLGIFMLFRLAFSFIKYIINPEEMEKGTSKLLTNLAVSLALIVSVPWIFNRAFALQSYIMDSNVIGNLIMGMDTTSINNNDDFNASSYGQTIGFLTFSAFYRPDSSIPELSPCNNLLTYYSDYVIPAGDREVKVDESAKMSDAARKEAEKIALCINELNNPEISTGDTEIGTMLYIASQRQSIGLYANSALLRAQYGNTYLMNYTYLVSTIAGGFLALLFLNFSFDVAIRNVKLCFLQIIAPIPIILNIEPGETKGDKKSLNWWVKECLQTYVLLFIRVATVYFGVFLIEVLFGSGLNFGSENTSVWFKIFMILGILLFVKQVPDMLGKAFGIDVKGEFKLNPLKRIGENKLASSVLGGAIGFAGGALGSGIAAYRGARANNAGRGEALRRALTGGIGGALHSGYSGVKTGAKSIHDVTSNATKNWQRSGRIAASNVGTTLGGRISSRVAMATGAKTRSQQLEDRAAAVEAPGKMLSSINNLLNGDKTPVNGAGVTFGAGTLNFKNADEVDDYLKNNTQLTDADRRSLMSARDAFAHAETLKSSSLIANGHRYSNYEEAIAAYANDKSLSTIEKHNLLTELNKRRSDISAAQAAQNVTLAGLHVDNVKDAYDYVERLKNSGASAATIKEAEDKVSIIKAMRYDEQVKEARSSGVSNAYSVIADNLAQTREANRCIYESHVTNSSGVPIDDFDTFANVKAATGSGNLAANVFRTQAGNERRNDDAVNAHGGGGK